MPSSNGGNSSLVMTSFVEKFPVSVLPVPTYSWPETSSANFPNLSQVVVESIFRHSGSAELQAKTELPVVPVGLPVSDEIVLIVLYTMTTALSVIGNTLAIVVFMAGRRSRTDLRWFLANLAVSDLIMSVFCMPFTFTLTMLDDWIFSSPMCPIVLFLQTVSVTVSVYTSVAVGVDRYWVVYYPLRSRITKSRSPVVIAAIWAAACTMSSVQLFVGQSNPYFHPSGVQVYDCMEVWPEPSHVYRRTYTFFLLVITYLFPLFLLSLTYGSVSRKLWQRTAPGNADKARDTQQLRSKRKVIKMLVIVVLLFAVCWLPLHAFILVVDFNPELTAYQTLEQKRSFVGIFYCVHWLAMSNSFVNPIIYGFLNDCFRSDLKWLLRVCFPCCRRLPCCSPQPPTSAMVAGVGNRGRVDTLGGGSVDSGHRRRIQLDRQQQQQQLGLQQQDLPHQHDALTHQQYRYNRGYRQRMSQQQPIAICNGGRPGSSGPGYFSSISQTSGSDMGQSHATSPITVGQTTLDGGNRHSFSGSALTVMTTSGQALASDRSPAFSRNSSGIVTSPTENSPLFTAANVGGGGGGELVAATYYDRRRRGSMESATSSTKSTYAVQMLSTATKSSKPRNGNSIGSSCWRQQQQATPTGTGGSALQMAVFASGSNSSTYCRALSAVVAKEQFD